MIFDLTTLGGGGGDFPWEGGRGIWTWTAKIEALPLANRILASDGGCEIAKDGTKKTGATYIRSP